MAALVTELREQLATELAAQLGDVPVMAAPPATVRPPLVYLTADTPWITVDRIGPQLRYTAGLKIGLVVPMLDNDAALTQLEDLVDQVLGALPAGVLPGYCAPPTTNVLGAQGSVLGAELSITAHLAAEVTPHPTEG